MADLTRRSLLRGGAVVAGGAVVGFTAASRSDAADDTTVAGANGYGPAAATGGGALAALTDVPDGGGLVLGSRHVVITRTGDAVHAFSATCTHQGCTVSDVSKGEIHCPCHGSIFDATTGKVLQGPATTPLPVVRVEVRAGSVFRTGGG
ncbi:MAG TPA: Rieske (2Fe-2S) protein [Actinomycetes bacterium]|nr:Rieske (2Fe-2S) protein [Actinomycetes bacterium]